MLITCPHCSTSYEVSAAAIGVAGRSVRCVRCRNVWHAPPPAEVPPLAMAPASAPMPEPASDETIAAFRAELNDEAPPLAEGAPAVAHENPDIGAEAPAEGGAPSLNDLMTADAAENAPPSDIETAAAAATLADNPLPEDGEQQPEAALSDIAIPLEDAPPLAPGGAMRSGDTPADADIETIAAARRKRRGNLRKKPAKPEWTPERRLPMIVLFLACMIAVLISFRASIVKRMPQLASLYATIGLPVNTRGLAFSDIRLIKDMHDGVPVLVVEGAIDSAARVPVEVPRLRFAVRNAAGAEVYAWTAPAQQEVLGPGESMAFRSRLAAPPKDARDVVVRFFTHRDAVAGLR